MRTLDRNKIVLWYVEPTGSTDEVDSDGNFTGNVIKTYGTPVRISLSIYPATNEIVEQAFGKDASCDKVCVTNEFTFDKDTLLFVTEPTTDYDTTYDYRIGYISESINTNRYGLVRRI